MKPILLFGLLFVTSFSYTQKSENLALTPPMGWDSWNTFRLEISDGLIREMADAMVQSGMNRAGYEYIILGDGWATDRDKEGNLIPDPEKFPNGIRSLADYIHSRGLKFGIYAGAGIKTCMGLPGSRGYEYQDARTFAAWGVDYVRYDWCNTGTQSAKDCYWLMSDAIHRAGRPMVFCISEWGKNEPWKWAKDLGHAWRTSGNILDSWDQKMTQAGGPEQLGWTLILDQQQGLELYSGPGHWNDPGNMIAGMGKLKENEYRAHFSLWCMLAAPLIAGNDLRNMDAPTLAVLINKEVIELNQDNLGKQGYKVVDEGDYEVWTKDLEQGDVAYCFFNRSQSPMSLSVDWKKLGVRGFYRIRDLWTGKNAGTTQTIFSSALPPHDVILLRLTKK